MESTGVLQKLFGDRKLKKNQTELDGALEVIIGLEKTYNTAMEAKHQAGQRLQKSMQAEILAGKEGGDHGGLTAEIAAAQARADAAGHLLVEARKEAAGLIAAGAPERREKIKALQQKIDELRQGRTRRLFEAAAAFARQWSLEVTWPKEFMAGTIALPARGSLTMDDVLAINKAAKPAATADPVEGQIDELLRELQDLSAMVMAAPDAALDALLTTARDRLT